MSDAPAVRRGRPRSEESSAAILSATLELVAEVGIAGLTVDAVACRAGVGKATIYRRWPSKEELLLEAWMQVVQTPVDPDTGDLREDLLALLAVRERTMPDHDLQRIFPQMIAAAKVNADVAAAYRAFIAERRRPLQAVLKRAAARGDLPAGLDLDVVHDLLVAPLLYRWLVSDGPIDDRVVGTIVDTVLAGLRVTTP